MSDLQTIQTQQGAVFEAVLPLTFGNDEAAIASAHEGIAICDRSHWPILRLTGRDRQTFLHNQTTNQIQLLQPGQGCETVFVNSTGRTIDLGTACVHPDHLDVIVSPGQADALLTWLDRYLFPADQVELHNISEEFALFTLLGPDSNTFDLPGLGSLNTDQIGSHCPVRVRDIQVTAIAGSGLSQPGYTLQVPIAAAAEVWQALTDQSAIPLGQTAWEQLRIAAGRPLPGAELTPDYNALEAGLWRAIAFNKGCYIGQETIARLNTHRGVKQRLWGVHLTAFVPVGTLITLEDQTVGKITSVCESVQGFEGAIALGYLKTKAGGAGAVVNVGDTTGIIQALPFLRHDYYDPPKP